MSQLRGTVQKLTGIGGGMTLTPVSSSPYTAGTSDSVFTIYNSSNAGFTFNLPSTPASSQIAVIVDGGLTAGTYAITIQGNGNNIIAYGSTSQSNIKINSNGGSISLGWDGTNWVAYA